MTIKVLIKMVKEELSSDWPGFLQYGQNSITDGHLVNLSIQDGQDVEYSNSFNFNPMFSNILKICLNFFCGGGIFKRIEGIVIVKYLGYLKHIDIVCSRLPTFLLLRCHTIQLYHYSVVSCEVMNRRVGRFSRITKSFPDIFGNKTIFALFLQPKS